jgi:sugar/nucleoside kinase (ribokinase family)
MTDLDLDVFVVGGVGIDYVVEVSGLPLPVQDALLVPPIRQYVGHTGNGVALGCLALGLRTAFADVIGDDPEGRTVLEAYEVTGLDFRHITHPSGTRRSVNLVEPGGRRLALYDSRHPFELVPDAALWRTGIQQARHVHVSIMNWCRHALADAIAAGRTTSTDLHDWDGSSDYHRDFAYGADYVFLSAAALGDRVDAVLSEVLERGRATAAIAMDGERGSRLAVPGRPLKVVPAAAIPNRPVIDSNGAGDSYVAAFLTSVLSGASPDAAATAGSIAGAFACGSAGTHTSFIDAVGLAQLLTAQPGQSRGRSRA